MLHMVETAALNWPPQGLSAMHVDLKGLGSRTKRLADRSIRYYITAWRSEEGDKAPVVAQGNGRDLDAARAAAIADLETEKAQDALTKARADRQLRTSAQAKSLKLIAGVVDGFLIDLTKSTYSEGYKSETKRKLEDFAADHGDWKLSLFDRPEVIGDLVQWRDKWRDEPRAADSAIDAVSRLFAWARQKGLTRAAPTADIARLYGSNRADIIWRPEDWEFAKANTTPAFYRLLRLAAALGLRQADLLRVPESALGNHSLALRTHKRKKLAVIPLTADARAVIAEEREARDQVRRVAAEKRKTPVLAVTIAANERGRPWTRSAVLSAMRRLKAAEGAPEGFADRHFHDLRGNAVTGFRRMGFKASRIALIMGWSEARVEQMLAIYCSGDDLALDMLRELEGPEQEPNLHTGLHTDVEAG